MELYKIILLVFILFLLIIFLYDILSGNLQIDQKAIEGAIKTIGGIQ
jgi:hypothetical protein